MEEELRKRIEELEAQNKELKFQSDRMQNSGLRQKKDAKFLRLHLNP